MKYKGREDMKDYILNYLLEQDQLGVEQLLLNMLVAFGVGVIIFATYRITYTGVAYSKKFNVSLMAMTLITTMIMSVISNNIALSLGMVGALSIVRFRTAIKDPRDTTYIYWGIAVGICCGVSYYLFAAVGSLVVALLLVVMGQVHGDGKYLIVVKGDLMIEKQVESIIYNYLPQIRLRVKNTTSTTIEFIYEVSERAMNKANRGRKRASISEQLGRLDGVTNVNIIAQDDDGSR